MGPVGLSEEAHQALRGLWIQGGVASLATRSFLAAPITIAVGTAALPVLRWSSSVVGEYLQELNLRFPLGKIAQSKNISPSLSLQSNEFSSLIDTAILGKSLVLSLGSILLLFLSDEPKVFLARDANRFEKIDLKKLDDVVCTPQEKAFLKVSKIIIEIRKKYAFEFRDILSRLTLTCAAVHFISSDGDQRTGFLKITLAGCTALLFLGLALKWSAWKCHAIPKEIEAVEPPQSLLEPISSQAKIDPTIQIEPIEPKTASQPTPLTYARRHAIRASCFGDLSALPVEILFCILQELPAEALRALGQVNFQLKHISFKYTEGALKPLRSQFGDLLVDALGIHLFLAPWVPLGDTLVEIPKCDDEDWDRTIYRNLLNDDPTWLAPVEIFKQKIRSLTKTVVQEDLEGNPDDERCHIKYVEGQGYLQDDRKEWSYPLVERRGEVGRTSFVHWINDEHLNDFKMIKFVDAAGRFGVAFRYQLTYFERNTKNEVPGIAILQQLRAGYPDYIWLEKQKPASWLNERGEIEFHFPKKDFFSAEQLRGFLFIAKTSLQPKTRTTFLLDWLHRFANGEPCGPIYCGLEAIGMGMPVMQISSGVCSIKVSSFFSRFWSKVNFS